MKGTKLFSRSFSTSAVGFLLSSIALVSTTIAPALANNTVSNQDSQINQNPTQLSEGEKEVCQAKKVNYSLYTNTVQSQVFETQNFPAIVKSVSMIYSDTTTKTNIVGLLNTEVKYGFTETIELSSFQNNEDEADQSTNDLDDDRWCCPCPTTPVPCCWC